MPTQSFLKSIYAKFFYDNEKKLDDQLKKSKSLCHIRAHVMSLLLEEGCGIQTFKISKFWDWYHWTKKWYKPVVWDFHCAVMIMDQEKNIWVWDPWEVRNKELPALQEWFSRNDEPIPRLGLVTNSINVMPKFPNRRLDFMAIADVTHMKAIQGVASSVFPNSPEPPISGTSKLELEAIRNNFLFFKSCLTTKKLTFVEENKAKLKK